ncbi:MAG: hypothetical protein M0002_05375 [Rhodospirillales bacterium]|nr:hypothetical protein [Rhodospirillales bacterium]
MNVAQKSASTALSALDTLYNSGTLTLYQGAIPATPETAIGTQTALAQFTFANPAFSSPVYTSLQVVGTASFVSANVTPTASGTACFARAVASTYGTELADYTVGAAWQPATAVMAGQFVINNGNAYYCQTAGTTAASGGPSGTGTNIVDGTAVWTFYNAGSTDIVISTTSLNTGVPISVTSLTHALPAI